MSDWDKIIELYAFDHDLEHKGFIDLDTQLEFGRLSHTTWWGVKYAYDHETFV